MASLPSLQSCALTGWVIRVALTGYPRRHDARTGTTQAQRELRVIGSSSVSSGLRHGLKQRHMTMIALGGVIGAGLFVGSGVVIKSAGPAAVVSFVITGLLVVLVMRMLGDMAATPPAGGRRAVRLSDRLDVLVFLGHRRRARGSRRCRTDTLLVAQRTGVVDQLDVDADANADESDLGALLW